MPAKQQQQQPSSHTYPPIQPGLRVFRRLAGKPVPHALDRELEDIQKKLLKVRHPRPIAFWEYPIRQWRKDYHLVRGREYQTEGLELLREHGRHMNPENRTLLVVQYHQINQRLNAILENDPISKEDCRNWKRMARGFSVLAELSSRYAKGREVEFELPPLDLDDGPLASGQVTPWAEDEAPEADRMPGACSPVDNVREYIETVNPSVNVRALDLAISLGDLVDLEDRELYLPLASHASSFFPLMSRDDLSILTADTRL
ncbi:hypothetical protein OH76DRAFT_1397173 [Lentinus brumalis]|uniref:Uncharacterized protein n=1 Tax=Lentinus brumalis TaxID=2498619 RepID=A0A371DQR8_9APHY|nr:hypothetical protein OH76DRAFT_1397173 [Polyporus brumalis]